MNTVSTNYANYASAYTQTKQTSVEIRTSVSSAKKTEDTSGLSDTARSYLDKLKTKYEGYDFIVADFSTDEQANSLLSKGQGEYNVLITPDTLEKMAADEKVAAEYESIISGADEQFDALKESLGDDAENVRSVGMTVDGTGKVNYYALLKDGLAKKNDTADKTDKSDKKDTDYSAKTNGKDGIFVKADTIEALLAKIKEVSAARTERTEENEKKADRADIPPESFEKYRKKDGFPSTEDDIASIPPESFEKYTKKKDGFDRTEETSKLPPKSFEKYLKNDEGLDIQA